MFKQKIKSIDLKIINDLKQEKDLKQKVINTIIEVEVLRINHSFKYNGDKDIQYRCEQARLFMLISDDYGTGRGLINKLIRNEVIKLVQIYHSIPPRISTLSDTKELILEYFFE